MPRPARIFEDAAGEAEPIPAGKLTALLGEHRIPIMVLNACQFARIDGSASDPFASVAAALLKGGIRAVVAIGYNLYGWLEHNEQHLALPTIVLAELRYGIARLAEGRRKQSLLGFWDATRDRFLGRTFSFDAQAARIYGEIVAEAERRGRTVKVGDGQIAAIALDRGMPVATRDTGDFFPTGVDLINPWSSWPHENTQLTVPVVFVKAGRRPEPHP